ncbi:MAG: type I restriction-modification system subunit M [Acetobacter sp.]|nr:type I restriction-modification system subunit M [Acetobacter sp.]
MSHTPHTPINTPINTNDSDINRPISPTTSQREAIHSAIWAIADDLRGAVDGWDFKNYVLDTMFYRYLSENLTDYINEEEHKAGKKDFDYARISDEDAEQAREDLVRVKGFFISPSELFCNVHQRAKNDANLNETLEKVFRHIEESTKGSAFENRFAGLFADFDTNSNRLGATVKTRNERITKLLDGVHKMELNITGRDGYKGDAIGDAYEYLMAMYASSAGKSGGEFFTPADVSELLTRLGTVGKKTLNKVYDPACGSGSLLLKAIKILGKDKVQRGFYGQEINVTTYNLCRINMFLHGLTPDQFSIECGDTLTDPKHWDDEPFELIVSNPPYSTKWAGKDNPLLIDDERFAPAGVLAPKSNADMAFIMHALAWLATNGTAAIVCFPGILYRGGAEQKIRQYLVDNNYVDCVIQLPSNLFFGTSIATCIFVMKKGKRDSDVLFIDASDDYVSVTKNNRLEPQHIAKIVEAFTKRDDVPHFAKRISYDTLKEADYNLSVSTYVTREDTREKIDITALNESIKAIVEKAATLLRTALDALIATLA